jgi:hypothetical protein
MGSIVDINCLEYCLGRINLGVIKKMKEIKEIVVLNRILGRYPLLKKTLEITYPGVDILVYDEETISLIRDKLKNKNILAVIADNQLLPIDIFSDIEYLYTIIGEGISSLILIEPKAIDNDIAFDVYFSSFIEVRIKKTFLGKRSFYLRYKKVISKYKTDCSVSQK